VRQAYDDLAEPSRLARHLAIIPTIALSARRPRRILAAAICVVAVAEAGRQKASGTRVFGVQASLLSVPWVLERGVCSWIALTWRMRGGCPYGGSKILRAATTVRELRLRARARENRRGPGKASLPGSDRCRAPETHCSPRSSGEPDSA
jgi:hypothetical protein